MSPEEKLNPQFDDEISFARYVIKNANNFMLLPLDNDTVAQLNDDMRSYCINTSTFIDSIKHMLAENNSSKNFGPISSEEFKSILQSDNNRASIDNIDTTTSNNAKPMEPEQQSKKDTDLESDEPSTTNLVNKRIM